MLQQLRVLYLELLQLWTQYLELLQLGVGADGELEARLFRIDPQHQSADLLQSTLDLVHLLT